MRILCNVSILMSVYNETEKELAEAIESMLNQTYEFFEFIIINDNPARKDLKIILEKYGKRDNRIKIINNKQNIGLAMSLNKAAKIAHGEILVRMDADDISLPNRVEKQLYEINNGYDLVFTPYIYIDEFSEPINSNNDNMSYFSPYDIHRILPIKNIIHHPTVMMTKEIFNEAGGYRDFPCAQDYDLWLRIYDVGGKFKMINEVLLKYRIREVSISKKKKYQQKITLDYTRKLFVERVITGKDSYTKDSYNKYLIKHGVFNQERANKMEYYSKILAEAKKAYYNNNYTKYYIYRLRVFIGNKEFRRSYIKKIRDKILLRSYIKDNLKSIN